ncbi:MAG: ImmA/IrrE family metallo-endopeptidase [Ignavibacteriaceae bacterium]|nr:ImmA/IrrE family metallo-endopeptidase [Ignavibacteriaceae bacterium]
MTKVSINTQILEWAVKRAELSFDLLVLEKGFHKIGDWLTGEIQPTIKQVEKLARKTHTPFGYFFLHDIPIETLPVPTFRTLGDKPLYTPSPELLDTIQAMQRRQNWMRDYLLDEKEEPLRFVGSANTSDDIKIVVKNIKETLGLNDEWTSESINWEDSVRILRGAIDNIGVLLVNNGIVGNNTSRKLNVDEFRGFVLIDEYAPLIFVNNSDFEGAKMFTIIHELAHVWLGRGAIFNLQLLQPFDNDIENFCNKIAAEFLVPENKIRELWIMNEDMQGQTKTLSRNFKVSPLVIARRALDLDFVSKTEYFQFYKNYKDDIEIILREKKKKKKGGGNFYNLQNVRIGKRFFDAIFIATKEGKVAYRDAFQLTGLYGTTFQEYSQRLGIG